MPPEGPIEIEFPSLAGSEHTNTRPGRTEPPESDSPTDEEGDDFAWLAAAFADDDSLEPIGVVPRPRTPTQSEDPADTHGRPGGRPGG